MESKDENQNMAQDESVVELRELVRRGKQGDVSVVPQLRQYLLQHPQVWNHVGDLARQSQAAWVRLFAGEDKHLQECIVTKVNAMKMELADERTSPLENLLVERVVSTWLELYYHETKSTQEGEKSLKWAEFRMKQLAAANDRHLKAIGALATFKKLLPEASPVKRHGQANNVTPTATNGDSPAIEVSKQPTEKVNGHANGQTTNRLAALLNQKMEISQG